MFLFLFQTENGEDDPFKDAEGGSGLVNTKIKDRESDYQKRRHNRVLREDALSFKESMQQANMEKERDELIREATKDDEDAPAADGDSGKATTQQEPAAQAEASTGSKRRKRRWDQGGGNGAATEGQPDSSTMISDSESATTTAKSKWDEDVSNDASSRRRRWDETPVVSSNVAATPLV